MPDVARIAQPVELDLIELVRVRLPLVEPFVTSLGAELERDVVLVRAVDADGREGWGECSTLSQPGYATEHTDGAWRALRDEIVPAALDGGDVALAGRRFAWSAVEAAFGDLARFGVRATYRAMGHARDQVSCGVVVGRYERVDELVDRVADRLADGYVQVKLKIGPGWDLAPLRSVRERWPDLALAADANGTYERGDLASLRALDDLGLVYLEQPLAPADLDGHALLRRELATPIALDESITSTEDLARALDAGALDVVNVKPARIGGEREFVRHMRPLLRSGDCSAFVGGMLETGIGRAFALYVASFDVFDLPTDLGPSSRYFAQDITDPFVLRPDGTMVVPDPAAPGVGGYGVRPLADRIDRFAVDRVTLHPSRPRARLRSRSEGSGWPAPPGWSVDVDADTATGFCARPLPDPVVRTVWSILNPRLALVLGSTQDPSVVDHDAIAAQQLDLVASPSWREGVGAFEVVQRQSGGGAVLLHPLHALWVDVIVPRRDPLWDDDVHRSFHWLGDAWARALGELGLDAQVHRGAPQRTPWSDLVCFAGLGPGEVTVEGRKAIGIAQRRTREAARFQCVAYTGLRLDGLSSIGGVVDLLAEPRDPDARAALRAHLADHTVTVAARTTDLLHAFLASLPR